MEKTLGNIPKQLKPLHKFIALELWFTKEKLWQYGKKNYGCVEKLWYYTENYGTLIYYGKNDGTIEKLWYYSNL